MSFPGVVPLARLQRARILAVMARKLALLGVICSLAGLSGDRSYLRIVCPSTTLSVWLVGPNVLRQRTLTPFLPASTNAVFQGFLAGYDYLNLSISEIFPLKINNLVTVTK